MRVFVGHYCVLRSYGMEDFFAPLVAKACLQVMPAGAGTFNVDSVRVNKIIGGSFGMSTLVNGMVVPRDTEGTSCTFTSGIRGVILIVNHAAGTVKSMANAKVVVFNVEVEATATENKGTVLIESSDQLMNYNRSEELAMEAVCTYTATFAAALSCACTCGTLTYAPPRAPQMIKSIAECGANVIITSSKFSEMAMHYCERYSIMMLKVSAR